MKLDWRTLRVALALLCLLALSIAGFWGVDTEWRSSDSVGRFFSATMQTLYAVLGLMAIAALYRRWRWTRELLWAWALALVLTGATAPVIWGEQGWTGAAMAAGITGGFALLVIWLAALPAPERRASLWHGLVVGLSVGVALAVIWATLRTAPLVVAGRDMEQFCRGMRAGVSQSELTDRSQRQGYTLRPGSDAKGPYLRIEDQGSGGHYYCEARFKPDGNIASMEFQANAKL